MQHTSKFSFKSVNVFVRYPQINFFAERDRQIHVELKASILGVSLFVGSEDVLTS